LKGPQDRVFAHFHYGGLYKRVVRMAGRAGIQGVHPHTFRHSFGVHFLDRSGGDAFALQDLLGHTNPRMTGWYVRSWRQRNATRRQRDVGLDRQLFPEE
jgi:integrase